MQTCVSLRVDPTSDILRDKANGSPGISKPTQLHSTAKATCGTVLSESAPRAWEPEAWGQRPGSLELRPGSLELWELELWKLKLWELKLWELELWELELWEP